MGLDVDMLGAKQLLGSLNSESLDYVNELAPAVVALILGLPVLPG